MEEQNKAKLEVVVTLKSKIDYIFGDELNHKINPKSEAIFNDKAVEALDLLAKAILKDSESKLFPDVITFGFFIRKANINKFRKRYIDDKNRFGRGLVFHIAPSNVALNFAYSMTASLLAGNSNVIRLASKDFPQTTLLIKLIKQCAKSNSYLKEKLCFIKYDRDDEVNEYFSEMADARVVWGGDTTVAYFRKYQTKPRCVDVMFANRNSLLVIDSRYILTLSAKDLNGYVEKFIQDALFFEQNACTSPKLVYWYGTNEQNKLAKEKFWSESLNFDLANLNIRGKETTDKLMRVIDLALTEKIGYRKYGLIDTVELNQVDDVELMTANRFGLFYELEGDNLLGLGSVLDDRTQTISYIAAHADQFFNELIESGFNQFDRIVPIGKSSDFDFLWDGYDLINTLSRKISVI